MRMKLLTTIIAASAVALTVGACSPKKAPSHVAETPKVEQVAQAPKVSLESLDARVKVIEDRNARVDAKARAKALR